MDVKAERERLQANRERLQAYREQLQAQVEKGGLREATAISIRNQIQGLSNEIHGLSTEISALTNVLPRLPPLPPEPDTRTYFQKARDQIDADPLVTGTSTATSVGFALWMLLRRYTILRHHYSPYTTKQLHWRQHLSLFDAQAMPGAKKIALLSAFVVMIRSWTTNLPTPLAK